MSEDAAHLRPVPPSHRTMTGWDVAALWVSLVANVPSFYFAGSLVDLGMSWWQGVATVAAGNTAVLATLVLAAHPGTRYGLPFPVLLRAPFGVRGAHLPALLRSLVACGWCSIESWIGAQAITILLPIPEGQSWYYAPLPWLGTSVVELACFFLFLLIQLAIVVWKGMAGIQILQRLSAPILVLLIAWLFAWAYVEAGGLTAMLSVPSRLTPSNAASVFFPSLTASAATWAGLALNISDFTRYARSQSDQVLGQLGLPFYSAVYAFAGLAIASSTPAIFGGRLISDPVKILREIDGGPAITAVAVLGVALAVVTTNVPANFVAPANALAGLVPSPAFGFAGGAAVTAAVGVAFQPWRILGSSESFVYTWLVGYSAVLGPITGVVLADYFVVRRTVLDVGELYSRDPRGAYYYRGGYNPAAFAALVVSVGPAVPGFLDKAGVLKGVPGVFVAIYDNAWFFGMFTAAAVYLLLSCWGRERGKKATATTAAATVPLLWDQQEPANTTVSNNLVVIKSVT